MAEFPAGMLDDVRMPLNFVVKQVSKNCADTYPGSKKPQHPLIKQWCGLCEFYGARKLLGHASAT